MIRYVDDLYPAADPRDGARVLRFTKQQQAYYEGVRNGVGAGKIVLRGTTSDAQAIDPSGLQYVRKVRINTAVVDGGMLSGFDELVVGGYWFEQGDFLALDRKRLRTLGFGGASTLAYLGREIMWSRTYLKELDPAVPTPQDPFDRIWRLWNQGDWAGGDFLGAVLWRVISEGLAFRVGATYTHRHADGTDNTDAHDDEDKLETAIPFVTLGFTQFLDSSGNAWTVPSGEFEAQVGDTLLEVTTRLMEAGLYVELDPDTFELRAWEVANHGRDRTGLAWGANVVRFEPPPPPSTDRTAGNILNDLKRALRPFMRVTALLAGGGDDTYAVATGGGAIPWHRHYPSDVSSVGALSAIASRQITARNDAGDTVQVRSKVGNDPSNGYYLPEEHAKLDDLSTVHSGNDTWDWDEAAYPIAKWSVNSRRTGAPDVFYHLGASYHSTGDRRFEGGAGVARHTHPPNPRLCDPALNCHALTIGLMTQVAITDGDFDSGDAGWTGGARTTAKRHAGSHGYQATGVTTADFVKDFGAQLFSAGVRYVIDGWRRQTTDHDTTTITFGDEGGDEEQTVYAGVPGTDPSDLWDEDVTGADGAEWNRFRVCWTPSADRTNVRFRFQASAFASSDFAIDSVQPYIAPAATRGTSKFAARCDHGHYAREIIFLNGGTDLESDNVQDLGVELAERIAAVAAEPSVTSHDDLTERDVDGAHNQYAERGAGLGLSVDIVAAAGAALTLDLAYTHHKITLTQACVITLPTFDAGGLQRVFSLELVGDFDVTLASAAGTVTFVGVDDLTADGNELRRIVLDTTDGTHWTAKYRDAALSASSSGHILITSEPAGSPLVFTDLMQNSEGTDLLYASEA